MPAVPWLSALSLAWAGWSVAVFIGLGLLELFVVEAVPVAADGGVIEVVLNLFALAGDWSGSGTTSDVLCTLPT